MPKTQLSHTRLRLAPLVILACCGAAPLHGQTSLSVSLGAPTANFASQAGASQNFTFSLADSAGDADMSSANLVFGNPTGSHVCYLVYLPGTNTLGLYDDSGGVQSSTPGAAGTISNNQCSVNLAASSVSFPTGSTLNLTLAITFATTFSGGQPMQGMLFDNAFG